MVNLPGQSIWVQFPQKLHKANRDLFLKNSCVSLDFPYLETAAHNGSIRSARADLELQRSRFQKGLDDR